MKRRDFFTAAVTATVISPLFVFALAAADFAAADPVVMQSARQLPVAGEVDLLVIGGTTGGVAAACEASRAGASVLLITPYPYLGEDRTATLRLAGEPGEDADDPLAVLLNRDERRISFPATWFAERLRHAEKYAFTYQVEGTIDRAHPETKESNRLTDGLFRDPVADSMQLNDDATIIVDLGEPKEIRQVILMAYRRVTGMNQSDVEKVELFFGDNKADWKKLEKPLDARSLEGRYPDGGSHVPFSSTLETPLKARYLKLHVTKPKRLFRMLLSELIVLPVPLPERLPEDDRDELKLPRPMHVKRVLDNMLLEAGVPFLFNTFAVDNICDENKNGYGAVIVNRGGRQAVLARKILDARSRVTSLEKAEWIVIGAPPRKIAPDSFPLLKSVSHEILGKPFRAMRRETSDARWSDEYPIVNYSFEINLPEDAAVDDIALRAEIEKQIRLSTYSPDQSFTSDEIFYPQDFKPLSFWREQGRLLAEASKSVEIPSPERLSVTSEVKPGQKLPGEIREVLGGLRSEVLGFEGEKKTISDPERAIPVLGKYDVVVVGGGTSGAPAGIAAGRYGAKTLVLEHLHELGGIGTAGAISIYWYGNVTGFTKEVLDGRKRWSIESKIFWWRSKLSEAGTDVWHGVLADGALVENGRVRGVLIATPFGPGIVEANVVIDATGNGDVAVAAGAVVQSYDDTEIAVQGAGLAPRNLGLNNDNTDFMFVDDNDVIDSSHVFVYAKEKYPHSFDQGKLLSTRERRQIVGEFCFNVLDQVNNRTYPDSIVYAYSDYDTHGYTIDPYMELNHPYHVVTKPDGTRDRLDRIYAYVPYRSSIPKGLDGILVAGLAMSAHRDALPLVRMQADLQNQGYAIGRAAAMLAAEPGKNIRDLDVRALQEHLVSIGNLAPAVATHTDNHGRTRDRLPGAVDSLPEHFRENVPLIMWYPEESRPLVRKAYLDETDFERKLIYARVAAELGDPIGVPTMLEKLKTYKNWDRGWGFMAMGQTGAATSPMDRWVMVLGRTGDKSVEDTIIEKARMLRPGSEFSHFRAIALALENIGGEKAARALSDLLDMPGMTGYVHDTIERAKKFDELGGRDNLLQHKTRRDSLVEISLARALYRCGDVDGKGETILRAYAKDLRGYFARHAREVLNSKRSN